MSIISDLTSGATNGLFSGIGNLVTNIRTAITGKTVLTPEEQTELLKQAAEIEVAKDRMQTDLMLAQVELNKLDAQSNDPIQRRWRPMLGWVCVAGLAYQFLICPIFPWMVKITVLIFKVNTSLVPDLPEIESNLLTTIILGMTGLLGSMRTVEKVKQSN